MAVSGRFEADFGEFYTAVRQANVELRGFELSNRNVERSVNELVNSFSGRRVMSEATIMAQAVRSIGGPSKLTAAELQSVGRQAEEAVEKFGRMGRQAPADVLRLATSARNARPAFTDMAGAITQVDGILGLFGVHTGPVQKALVDLQNIASLNIGTLGALAPAVLTAAAAFGGWKLGRVIAETGQLDDKIADLVNHLRGLPTIAEESAKATADAIARARKQLPGVDVQSAETAQAVNAAAAEEAIAKNKEHEAALQRQEQAALKSFVALQKINDEMQRVKDEGLYDSLIADINAHALGLDELATNYGISTEAAGRFAAEAAKIASVEDNNARQLQKIRDEMTANEAKRSEDERIAAEKRAAAFHEETQAAVKAQEERHNLWIAEQLAQDEARRKTEAETKALREQEEQAKRTALAVGSTVEYNLATSSGRARFAAAGGTLAAAATPEYFNTHTLTDAIAEGLARLPGFNPNWANTVKPTATGPTAQPVAIAAAPTLPLPPLEPLAAGELLHGSAGLRRGGFGQVVYAPVFVSGVFDPSSSHALGATVSKAIATTVSNTRVLGG